MPLRAKPRNEASDAMLITQPLPRWSISRPIQVRESTPSLLAIAAVTILLIFVPQVVLFLPNLLFGSD
jgi:hypothetical protein